VRKVVYGARVLPSRRQVLSLGLAAPLAACAPRPATRLAPPDDEVPASLRAHDDALERAMGAHSLAEWHAYTQEGAAPEGGLAALQVAEHALFQRVRPDAERALRDAPEGSRAHRAATLWLRGARGLALVGDPETSRLAHELEARLNEHAFRQGERSLTRAEVRRMAGDARSDARREAMMLQSQAHLAVADVARALLQRRHAVARAQGVASWGDAMLELRGISPARWDALDRYLDAGTRAPHQRRLDEGRRTRGLTDLAPWDLTYVLAEDTSWADAALPADDALARVRRVLAGWGFDTESPPVRVLVREFAFGGQTLSIRVPDDVRTVLRTQAGFGFHRTLLHELGHAMQATRTTVPEAIFKGYEWVPGISSPGFDEGMAETFALLFEDPAVLHTHGGLDPEACTRLLAITRRQRVGSLRATLAAVAFERAALADPTQDLDALHRAVLSRYHGVAHGPDAPPTWANTPFLATYPMYQQSYVLAALVSSQVHASLRARFGERWYTPEGASYVARTLFAQGERVHWERRIAEATGRPLDARDLLARLAV
jgi:hypothetical protein